MAIKTKASKPAAPQSAADTEAAFAALVAEKIQAGLPKRDAEECARAQLAHDAALAASEPDPSA